MRNFRIEFLYATAGEPHGNEQLSVAASAAQHLNRLAPSPPLTRSEIIEGDAPDFVEVDEAGARRR